MLRRTKEKGVVVRRESGGILEYSRQVPILDEGDPRYEELANCLSGEQRACGKIMARHGMLAVDIEEYYPGVLEWMGDCKFREFIDLERRKVNGLEVREVMSRIYGMLRELYDILSHKFAAGEGRDLDISTVFVMQKKLFDQFLLFADMERKARGETDRKVPSLEIIFKEVRERFDSVSGE